MSIRRPVDVNPTADEMAEELAAMSSHQQAVFLNRLARYDWWPMQLQYISGESILTGAARNLMRMIGEYANDPVSDDYAQKIAGRAI